MNLHKPNNILFLKQSELFFWHVFNNIEDNQNLPIFYVETNQIEFISDKKLTKMILKKSLNKDFLYDPIQTSNAMKQLQETYPEIYLY